MADISEPYETIATQGTPPVKPIKQPTHFTGIVTEEKTPDSVCTYNKSGQFAVGDPAVIINRLQHENAGLMLRMVAFEAQAQQNAAMRKALAQIIPLEELDAILDAG